MPRALGFFILHVTPIHCFSTLITARPFRALASASTYFALQKGPRAQYIYISPTFLPRILAVSTFTTWRLVVMPNNRPLAPLRRLSVVLRLSEAYSPTQVLPPTPSSRSSLSAYLANVKNSYLKDIKEDPKKGAGWTVVMGNEAGGMIVRFTVSV